MYNTNTGIVINIVHTTYLQLLQPKQVQQQQKSKILILLLWL